MKRAADTLGMWRDLIKQMNSGVVNTIHKLWKKVVVIANHRLITEHLRPNSQIAKEKNCGRARHIVIGSTAYYKLICYVAVMCNFKEKKLSGASSLCIPGCAEREYST